MKSTLWSFATLILILWSVETEAFMGFAYWSKKNTATAIQESFETASLCSAADWNRVSFECAVLSTLNASHGSKSVEFAATSDTDVGIQKNFDFTGLTTLTIDYTYQEPCTEGGFAIAQPRLYIQIGSTVVLDTSTAQNNISVNISGHSGVKTLSIIPVCPWVSIPGSFTIRFDNLRLN